MKGLNVVKAGMIAIPGLVSLQTMGTDCCMDYFEGDSGGAQGWTDGALLNGQGIPVEMYAEYDGSTGAQWTWGVAEGYNCYNESEILKSYGWAERESLHVNYAFGLCDFAYLVCEAVGDGSSEPGTWAVMQGEDNN